MCGSASPIVRSPRSEIPGSTALAKPDALESHDTNGAVDANLGYEMANDNDQIWKALADPTRREILDQLRDGPRQTTEIVEAFPQLSRFGVMKHLDVLRDAGLVTTRSEGRLRINSLNAAPLRDVIERWIGRYEAYWANTLLRVKESAESDTKSKRKSKSRRA